MTARAALSAEQFGTPDRARSQFKADMIDESSQLDAEAVSRSMQPFQLYTREGGAAVAASSSSASSSTVPPPPVMLVDAVRANVVWSKILL